MRVGGGAYRAYSQLAQWNNEGAELNAQYKANFVSVERFIMIKAEKERRRLSFASKHSPLFVILFKKGGRTNTLVRSLPRFLYIYIYIYMRWCTPHATSGLTRMVRIGCAGARLTCALVDRANCFFVRSPSSTQSPISVQKLPAPRTPVCYIDSGGCGWTVRAIYFLCVLCCGCYNGCAGWRGGCRGACL